MTGVKVDDVNNDGVNEIWCGDAIGHIYLFRQSGGTWNCIYRSGELGCFPGCYNNIYPLKETDSTNSNYGMTVKLLITSPGYVTLFAVDPILP